MDVAVIENASEELYRAWLDRRVLPPLTDRNPELTLEDAYRIQQRLIGRHLADGAKVVGKKIGVTSKAVMDMLGVRQPDFGHLLDSMRYASGEAIRRDSLIQPRAEGEVAFLLKKDLYGPGICSFDVLAATECVIPCLEIVDSRIRDWKIKVQDTVADNASCGAFVLGERRVGPHDVDLLTCGMVLEKNGEVAAAGAGAAALGSPVNAVAWLANALSSYESGLKAGDVILSGALAAMLPAQAGDHFAMTVGGIGSCSVRFV